MQVKHLQQLKYLLGQDVNVKLIKVSTKDIGRSVTTTMYFTFSTLPDKCPEMLVSKAAKVLHDQLVQYEGPSTQSVKQTSATDISNGAGNLAVAPSTPQARVDVQVWGMSSLSCRWNTALFLELACPNTASYPDSIALILY